MKYITKDNKELFGKPKVFISCHPDDANLIEHFANLIWEKQECFIFYRDYPNEKQKNNTTVDSYARTSNAKVQEMDLFVILVSENYFLVSDDEKESNDANYMAKKDFLTDYETARINNIPVLPFMIESKIELVQAFNQICGNIQYMNENVDDETAIPFDKKLEDYLHAIFVSDELEKKIPAAFDAVLFLSYRKKNRKYANAFIQQFHDDKECRRIAVWYDEFLVAGEEFNRHIERELIDSDVFVLIVTQDVLEENNYVLHCEYPKAKRIKKPIVAIECDKTDMEELKRLFPDIPECISLEGKQAAVVISEALKKSHHYKRKTPENTFLMGLAYLLGNHAEKNFDTAFELIKEASEEKYLPAMKKLAEIYRYNMNEEEGENLKKNKKHEKNQNDENAIKCYLSYLKELKDEYYRYRSFETATKLYDERIDFSDYCKHLSEFELAEDVLVDNIGFIKELSVRYLTEDIINNLYMEIKSMDYASFFADRLANCYRILAWIAFMTNQLPNAVEYYQEAIDTTLTQKNIKAYSQYLDYYRSRQEFCKNLWDSHKKIFEEKQTPYTMEGEYVYYLESEKGAIPSGMNIGEGSEVSDMPLLAAILCLGPGGPLYDTMKAWWKAKWGIDLSDEQAYLYTHVCANYVYQSATGGAYAWKGYNADVANAFFGDYLAYASDLAAGNMSAADGDRYENFKCYIIGTSGSLQNMGYRASCTKKPIPQPTQINVTVLITKDGISSAITDDTITVEGAVYGVYKKSNNNKVGEITLALPDPSNKTVGQGKTVITITDSGQYYVKEITPPHGFELDEEEYPFTVYVAEQSLVADCTEITIPEKRLVSVDVTDTPETMAFNISVEKIKSAQSYNGATPPSLAGAVYTLYDQYNNQLGSITLSDATTDPQNPKATGKFIGDLFAGTYYIKETSAPTSGGWTLDTNEYWFKADPSAGTDGMGELTIMGDTGTTTSSGYIKVSNRNLTLSHIEEASGSGSFGFKKARMVNGNYANLEGAVFEMYNYKDVKKNADGSYDLSGATPVATYTSNASGKVVGTDIPTGSYVFRESVVPAGFKACKDFVLTIFDGQITYPESNIEGEKRPIILDESDETDSE